MNKRGRLLRLPRLEGGRQTASIAVHPQVKRELRKMAQVKGCSVSYLLCWLVLNRWHFDYEELVRP